MIGRLSGKFIEATDTQVLLDVGGVGYELDVTTGVLGLLPASGAPLSLYTHLVVREDAQLLYGFDSRHQRDLFRSLIRVNGVGPKLALALLSALTAAELAQAVNRGDVSALTRISGVGKKTAERLLVELKGKVDAGLESVSAAAAVSGISVAPLGPDAARAGALDALKALGYRPAEAERMVQEAALVAAEESPKGVPDTAMLVRLALRG
ncbi:MAG: Holliday junction branch migration protein RuvA, partial [Pseudomonadota bacterium]